MAKSDAVIWRGFPERSGTRQSHEQSRPGDDEISLIAIERAQIRAAQQNIQDFAPLYEKYVDLVWRYARSRLESADRAADATSSTFHKAIAALPTFLPRERNDTLTFRSWLMTIARNVVIDEIRRSPPTKSIDSPAVQPWLIDVRRSPEDYAISRDEQHRVNFALSKLPETQRQIVELRLAGLKFAEITDALGMSLSAVKTSHFRAYARLRILLAETDQSETTSNEIE